MYFIYTFIFPQFFMPFSVIKIVAFYAGYKSFRFEYSKCFYSQWGLIPKSPPARGSFRAVRIGNANKNW
jgi:hypothetical protein